MFMHLIMATIMKIKAIVTAILPPIRKMFKHLSIYKKKTLVQTLVDYPDIILSLKKTFKQNQ